MTGDPIPLNLHVGNPACVDMAEEVGVADIRLRTLSGGPLEQIEQRDQQEADDDPERQVLAEIVPPRPLCRRLDSAPAQTGRESCWERVRHYGSTRVGTVS